MHPLILALVSLVLPELVAPGGEAPRLGAALALDGSTLAAGAPDALLPDALVPRPRSGAVGLWRHDGLSWRRDGILRGDGRPDERFGCALDLEGGRLAVGAYFADGPEPRTGAVHVFEQGPGWTRTARLVPADAEEFDGFGWSLSLEGERLLVGAPFADRAGFQSGDARVYRRVRGRWVLEDALRPAALAAFDHLGWSVAWWEGRALVGAPDSDLAGAEAGAVFVFEWTPGGWEERPTLLAPDLPAGAGLGASLGSDGGRVIAGAPWADRLRIWRRRAGDWDVEATLVGTPSSHFGAAATLSGPWLLVGAPQGEGSGAVHRYRRSRGAWNPIDLVLGGSPGAALGSALALEAGPGGFSAALGAPFGEGGCSSPCAAGRVEVWD